MGLDHFASRCWQTARAATTVLLFTAAISRGAQTSDAQAVRRDYPIKPVPFTDVHVSDEFWAPRIEINRTVSIPTAFGECERTGRIDNFLRAAEVLQGKDLKDKHPPGFPFDDTDPYKVIEGASYALSVHPDPKLDAYVDSLIAKIAAAQEPDGYLYTTRSIDPQHPHEWAGKERWVNEEILSHELYNAGHLYEAAYAHYQATGKRTLLDVALKNADLLVRTFGPGKRKIYPGHQIVEIGLVKLYRVTGKQDYLDLAKFMLECRGGGSPYNQADIPVVNQTEAEGHAVRATYMYSGMADVAAMTGDKQFVDALDKIWESVVTKKLYITGGIGALAEGEAFGAAYQLPNMTAYNETCAAVGNDFWNQRMFLLHGDSKYVDVFERTLYNGLISGVSLDGKTYFYPNPLESNGQHQRSPWFGVACCPGNITRFVPSIPGYVYAEQGDTLYVNLFMTNTAGIVLGNGQKLKVAQDTHYPWAGDIKILIDPEQQGTFTVKVRVPGWARNEAVPGDLYSFTDETNAPVKLAVNGKGQPLGLESGYATIHREWRKGDYIQIDLPMPIRRIEANSKVEADVHRVALERGPIVYAVEWPDSPDHHVRNILLQKDQSLKAAWKPDLLKGVEVIEGKAVAYRYDGKGNLEHSEESFTAIPYYAWANRGPGQMEVWIADKQAGVHPMPYPSLASKSTVKTSGPTMAANGVRDPKLVADQEEPSSSADASSFYDWLPKRGTQEWIQYDLPNVTKVSSVDVYWFQEPGRGPIKLPASWRALYKAGDEWKPIETADSYGTAPDRYNHLAFKSVATDAVRIEVQLQPEKSAGISEWKVN
jgi:DUF1680 family protein